MYLRLAKVFRASHRLFFQGGPRDSRRPPQLRGGRGAVGGPQFFQRNFDALPPYPLRPIKTHPPPSKCPYKYNNQLAYCTIDTEYLHLMVFKLPLIHNHNYQQNIFGICVYKFNI